MCDLNSFWVVVKIDSRTAKNDNKRWAKDMLP